MTRQDGCETLEEHPSNSHLLDAKQEDFEIHTKAKYTGTLRGTFEVWAMVTVRSVGNVRPTIVLSTLQECHPKPSLNPRRLPCSHRA